MNISLFLSIHAFFPTNSLVGEYLVLLIINSTFVNIDENIFWIKFKMGIGTSSI